MKTVKTYFGIVQDSRGRILGKYSADGRDLLRTEIDIIRNFLCGIYNQNQESKQMGSAGDECRNEAKIAGKIESIKVDDKRAFLLVNTNTKDSKFVPCTAYDVPELLRRLRGFERGDGIKIIGFVRAWSRKVEDKEGDKWENSTEVRITQVVNNPPERKKSEGKADEW